MAKKSLEEAGEELGGLGESLSLRLKDALVNARDWKDVAEGYIKKSPAVCLAGAFIVGFALAKVARHA